MTGPNVAPGLVVFSHGLDSSPAATKICWLRPLAAERGYEVAAPDYRGLEGAPARAERLEAIVAEASLPVTLVGSSMGGIVSVLVAQRRLVRGLFLLAPAVYYPGYEHLDHAVRTEPIHIVHGWRDAVIAPEAVIRFAREHRALLHLVDDDHRLSGDRRRLERLFEGFLAALAAATAAEPPEPAHDAPVSGS